MTAPVYKPGASDALTRPLIGRATLPILCAGMFSSGSTWMFNALSALLTLDAARAQHGGSVSQFFADSLIHFPDDAAGSDILLIKCHEPDAALHMFRRLTQAAVLVSIREPRDAATSLMQRFGFSFEHALERVASAAGHILVLVETDGALILRYEDRFFENPATMARLAAQFGLDLDMVLLNEIHISLTRENVASRIERLARAGTFGTERDPNTYDLATLWHPGHVGDAAIGKFDRVLSADQQTQILDSTRPFCEAFGYEPVVAG